jgi:hypothetical protein
VPCRYSRSLRSGTPEIGSTPVSHIGKEANLLEQQEEGILVTDPQAAYFDGTEWNAIRPHLDRVSIAELSARSGVSARMLRDLK